MYKGSALQANEILKKLKGKKYLIKGNHDDYANKTGFDASAFEWVKDYEVLSYNDARFILFHYPILEWAHYYRKSAHLYGHVHNHTSNILNALDKRAINVGVDVNNFYPISIKDIYIKAFDVP